MSLKINSLFLIMAAISIMTTITSTINNYAYADSLNFVDLNVIVNPNAHASSPPPNVINSPQVVNTPSVVNVPSYVNTQHVINHHIVITHHMIRTPHMVMNHHLVNTHRVINHPPPNNPFNSKSPNGNPGVNIIGP
ncbi:MAG TPA: hypothetical protein VIY08_08835 [Candidatus Nitrosocosmicus sp.]